MGSESKSSSQSTSNEVTDSNNTTLTNSSTGDGNLSINAQSVTGALTGLSYAYDSNNPITTTNNDQTYALGANSTAAPSNTSSSGGNDPGTSGFDWSEVVIYVVAGVILWAVMKYGLGDKNA